MSADGGDVGRPRELLGRIVPALRLDDDDQNWLTGGRVGDHHDGIGQELGRNHLGQVGGTERDRDLGRQLHIGPGAQQLDGEAGILADERYRTGIQ
jgi:hypothetical protein